MKTAKGRAHKRLGQTGEGPRIRRYYIFDCKVVNEDECIVQGRASIQKGDYDQVEIHRHGTDIVDCDVHVKNEPDVCFRFGKGIQ